MSVHILDTVLWVDLFSKVIIRNEAAMSGFLRECLVINFKTLPAFVFTLTFKSLLIASCFLIPQCLLHSILLFLKIILCLKKTVFCHYNYHFLFLTKTNTQDIFTVTVFWVCGGGSEVQSSQVCPFLHSSPSPSPGLL